MRTTTLRRWTDIVRLHADVETGAVREAVFAMDLGAIAAGDPNVRVVNRDPGAFLRATYLTADLPNLVEEALASLADQSGCSRVVTLCKALGGGRSRTLAALYHAARKRGALALIPEARYFPVPAMRL